MAENLISNEFFNSPLMRIGKYEAKFDGGVDAYLVVKRTEKIIV